MPLPKYGSSKQGMRVLDHRTAANPWGTTPVVAEDDGLGVHEPTDAERARTVVSNNRLCVLSVNIADQPAPLGFVLPYATDDNGNPIIGIRPGVVQAAELRSGAPCCLTVAETPLTATHSGGGGGVTLMGTVRMIEVGNDLDAALSHFVRTQPADAAAVKRGAERLYKFVPNVVLTTSGGGEVVGVTTEDYYSASSDPLAAVAPGLVSHLSSDQGGSLVLLARAFGGQPGARSAELAGIDQYGMDLLVQTAQGRESVRITFGHPVSSPEEVRRELTAMARGARFKLGVG